MSRTNKAWKFKSSQWHSQSLINQNLEIMRSEFITITAVDKHSSDSMSRTFSTTFKGFESPAMLKAMVEEWEKEIPYRRYELVTQDFIEDYSDEIQGVLDELEVTN